MTPFIYLAPMRGFTNALYRNLLAAHFQGVDAAIAPFIPSLSAKPVNRSHIKDILPENNTGMPVIPQILGNNADAFIRLALRCHDLGYDTVNWNLGCPFPMVAKKQRGSGLLPHPELIEAFLDKVIPRSNLRVSIKLRLGRKEKEEIFSLIPVLNNYPLAEIIIHPRTGIQMYTGTADPNAFEQCLPLLTAPVAYNGDIFDLNAFTELRRRFPTVSRWVIGRGLLSNPFLPGVLRSGNEKIRRPVEKFKEFHDDLLNGYCQEFSGPSHVVNRMKGYWQYFSLSFRNGKKIFKQIKKMTAIKTYKAATDNFFKNEATWDPNLNF